MSRVRPLAWPSTALASRGNEPFGRTVQGLSLSPAKPRITQRTPNPPRRRISVQPQALNAGVRPAYQDKPPWQSGSNTWVGSKTMVHRLKADFDRA